MHAMIDNANLGYKNEKDPPVRKRQSVWHRGTSFLIIPPHGSSSNPAGALCGLGFQSLPPIAWVKSLE